MPIVVPARSRTVVSRAFGFQFPLPLVLILTAPRGVSGRGGSTGAERQAGKEEQQFRSHCSPTISISPHRLIHAPEPCRLILIQHQVCGPQRPRVVQRLVQCVLVAHMLESQSCQWRAGIHRPHKAPTRRRTTYHFHPLARRRHVRTSTETPSIEPGQQPSQFPIHKICFFGLRTQPGQALPGLEHQPQFEQSVQVRQVPSATGRHRSSSRPGPRGRASATTVPNITSAKRSFMARLIHSFEPPNLKS